jgi:transport family protein 27
MASKHVSLTVLRCKLVIVGDPWVGKSALTQVFSSGGSTYPKNYLMTVGAEFCVKQLRIPDTNVMVELSIFDCAGQSIFNQVEMNNKYYEHASAVMVVYDVTSNESLQSCNRWITNVRSMRPVGPPLPGVMVGNKCEFRDGAVDARSEVSKADAQRLAHDLGLGYFETSAANNSGVEDPFMYIAREFHRRYEDTVQRADTLGGGL